jgi:YaiO family outer membrane protein
MINCKKKFSKFYWNFNNQFILVSMLVLLVFSGNISKAQTYDEAKDLAYNGEREKAREICRKLLAEEFDSDVAVLMARLYAWDGKYDSTRVYISQVLDRYPEHWDAFDCLSDVQYWEEKYPDAIKSCDIMLAKDPKDETFMFKKAKILNAMEQYDQAADQLEALLKIYPSNAEARNKLEDIRLDQMKNRVRIAYTLDCFEKSSNKDPWHLLALSYGRKTSIGTVIGRVNWAQRYGDQSVQYEVDAYPSITEKDYAYVNVGVAEPTIFPKFRSGVEWYHSFPKAFEGSIGMRALVFDETTFIYTGSAGKYIGNYWISFRAYVTPSSSGASTSGSIQARRYFSDPENYVGLRVGYGISPDDKTYGDGTSSYLTLKSQSMRMEFNHLFNKIWTTNLAFSLSNEEYRDQGYVLNYSFEFAIGRFF